MNAEKQKKRELNMVEVVQYFNGERRRTVGKADTRDTVEALVKSVSGASEGWGVRIRGTKADLLSIDAYKTLYGGWVFAMKHPEIVDCDAIMDPT